MIRTIKTKQFKITAALLALVLTVSCVMLNATKAHALQITDAATSGYTVFGGGTVTDGKLTNTSIGVFVTGGSADKYNATNVKWTHNGTSWTAASPILYEGADSIQKISAYYPYVEGSTGSVTVIASEQTDWLVAPATDLTSSNVNLNMTHALTKLVINPTFGTEVTNQMITSIEVGGMYATGTLNIADNSWSDHSEANTTLEMKNNELLVIPMASCTSFDVVITMSDGKTFTTTVSLAGTGNKLAAGTQYNISLQVGQDKVTIGSITASPWEYAAGGNLETE